MTIACTLSLLILESIFWFSTSIRYGLWQVGVILVFLLVAAMGIGVLLVRQDWIPRYALFSLAREVGEKGLEKHDEALNALQLESTSLADYRSSQQLANQFVQNVAAKLDVLDESNIFENYRARRFRTAAAGTVIFGFLLLLGFYSSFQGAVTHWMHPKTDFPIPHPFELASLTGDLSLMGGDDTTIAFIANGKMPQFIELEIRDPENTTFSRLALNENETYTYSLKDVFQNIHYRAFAMSAHFWEPWDEISSPSYSINVIDRPTIEDFTMTLSPPSYTGMSPVSQKGNIAEIRGLRGSIIGVQLRSDRVLSRAYLKCIPSETPGKPFKINMEINRKRASIEFSLKEDGIFETYIFDQRKIGNLDPIQYHFMVIEDTPPELQVLEPTSPMELGSDFEIPIQLHIEDDFGFSNLQIVHETKHPDYVSPRTAPSSRNGNRSVRESHHIVNIHRMDTFSREETSQDVFYVWDVGNLNLMPEDEIHFHFELYDNDIVSGPKKSVSPTLVARFPSLADLFARTVHDEQMVEDKAQEIVEDLQEIDKALESLELEALKNEKLSWEQEQKLKQSVDEVKKKLEEIQSLQEKLQKIVEQSEKHDLFSTDLIEKFRNLQELLQNIMTPELEESMEKMREAMSNLPSDLLLQALQNFRVNTEELEEQLDRFIDIFKRIQAEQRIDELVVRMQRLIQQQEALVDTLNYKKNNQDIPRLAEEQERNRREFENIRDFMEETSESMEVYATIPAGELQDLAQSDLSDQTSKDLKSASDQLRHNKTSDGFLSARSAHSNLQQILSRLQKIQEAFQQQTVGEMVAMFETVLRNTLFISKEQESLQTATKDVPRNSPRLGDMAVRQHLLRDQLAQLIRALMELSHQTFAVSPEMGRAIGRATAGMNESLKKLEERNGHIAAENQKKTVAALNEAALATLAAINDIRESGMASGLEQFLERMQQMSSQQQGINQQTLQLMFGQMAASEQEKLMRRLASEQERLRKSVDQLKREMRGSRYGGETLNGVGDEMEKVINDLKRRKITRQTIDRQQRILTRMLDSQKSLKRQDFSEKRKAIAAQDIIRKGPSGLPEDLGQRRNLAMEALNLALKSGYSRDYQEMIRRYFNSLIESPDLIESENHVKP